MELPRLRTVAALAVAVPVLAVAAFWWSRPNADPESSPPIPGEEITVTVEVLNGTLVDGLARAVTRQLRRAGIDVVYFGSAAATDLDSTVILVRRGDSLAALPVRNALGRGRIVVEPDSLLLLDLTVLLGRDLAGVRGISP